MDDNEIPPIMRAEPSSPNGTSPYPDGAYIPPPIPRPSIPLTHGLDETVYPRQPRLSAAIQQRLAYLETRKDHYKQRLIVWQFMTGALTFCVIVLFIWMLFHVQIVYGAPGGQP